MEGLSLLALDPSPEIVNLHPWPKPGPEEALGSSGGARQAKRELFTLHEQKIHIRQAKRELFTLHEQNFHIR